MDASVSEYCLVFGRLGLLQFPKIFPGPVLPRFQAGLGELHSLGSFSQVVRKSFVENDMADEQLPLNLEGVVKVRRVGHLLPPS